MPRAPRHTETTLKRSSLQAHAASCQLKVLRELHPNNPNLAGAERLFRMFEQDLHEEMAQLPITPAPAAAAATREQAELPES